MTGDIGTPEGCSLFILALEAGQGLCHFEIVRGAGTQVEISAGPREYLRDALYHSFTRNSAVKNTWTDGAGSSNSG